MQPWMAHMVLYQTYVLRPLPYPCTPYLGFTLYSTHARESC